MNFQAVTSTAHRVKTIGVLFWSIALLYVVLDGLYLLHCDEHYLLLVAGFCNLLNLLLCILDPLHGLYLTVFTTHLGAIPRFELLGSGAISPGDIHLFSLTIGFFVNSSSNRTFYLGPFPKSMGLMALLIILNLAFTPEFKIALPGIISMIQLALVYLFTLNLVKNETEAKMLIMMIGFAVLVSAIIHIVAFTQNRSLLLSLKPHQAYGLLCGYTKTSFFYGSFIGSCTVALGLSMANILEPHKRSSFFWFWIIVGLFTLVSTLVQGSRTPIVAACISGIILIGMNLWYHGNREVFRRLIAIALSVPLLVTGAVAVVLELKRKGSFAYFIHILFAGASESMSERFLMWQSIPQKILEFPKEFFFGIGPDVPQRGIELDQVRNLMHIPGIELKIFSFHNFYLDTIFQEGFFFFIIFVYIIISTVSGLTSRFVRSNDPIVRNCLFALLAWLVMWNSHATGWSKPVLIMSELMGLAHLAIYKRAFDARQPGQTQ